MKLPRLQLHLSTCIVLMFVAGGIVGFNLLRSPRDFIVDYDVAEVLAGPPIAPIVKYKPVYGWPFRFTADKIELIDAGRFRLPITSPETNYLWLAADLATALAILAAVAFVCEWLIRRRKKELFVTENPD